MKKSVKIISLLLSLLMVFGVFSVAVSAEEAECQHEYGKWYISQDETCTENGIKYRECTKCDISTPGHIETGFVLATGHDFSSEGVVTPPTCGNEGYTTYTCKKCLETKKENVVEALAHTYGEWVETLPATCTSEGEKSRACALCSEGAVGHVETASISALGHDYVLTVVAPTYTEEGYTLYVCARCSSEYKDNYTDKLKGKVEKVELGEALSVKYNETLQLNPAVNVGGNVNYTYAFVSSNEEVVTVDENGLLTGRGMGKAVISCTVTDEYGNTVSDTVDVQVKFTFANWMQILREVLKAAIDIVIGGIIKGFQK